MLDHTTTPCWDSASTTTFSNLASMILASAHSASLWIMAASLVSDRLIPLVMGELVRQIPCSREVVDCEDGF